MAKSQTETLMYGKVEVCDFPVKTEHLRLISCLLYGCFLFLQACNQPIVNTGE